MPKNMDIAWLFDFYGDMLTDKQRQVVTLYYEEDLSLAEIAENQHITRQGVRDSLKRAEAQMREMEERLELAGRFREMQAGLDAIYRAAQEIQSLNEQCGGPHEVEQRAERIIDLAQQLRER